MATIRSKIYENICEALLSSQAAVYVPTTAYKGSLPSKTVRKGSKGTNVKHVQTFLNWCMKSGLKVDGSCGSKTVAAIKKFQKQYKLKVDGVFGAKSKAKAQSIVNAHKPKPAPKPTPKPTPKPAVNTKAQKLVEKAKEYAWPSGTSSKITSYKTGYSKAVYRAALKKYIHKKAKISQSDCGYFVSTVVREVMGNNFLALKKANEAFVNPPSDMKIVYKGKVGTLQPGDIIRYKKTNGHQHVVMYIGDGKIAHAGRGHWFPKIASSKPWNNSNVKKSTIQVIRAK